MSAPGLFGPLFRWEAVGELFTDRARVQAMLDFEGALARAEAHAGVISAPASSVISAHCRVESLDMDALARECALAGNLAIPLIGQLTARVAAESAEAARFVHWGATSQDAIDTGFVLQLRGALARIQAELARLGDALASLAEEHRATPIAGRTFLQHAAPTTFGLKAAGWLDAVDRDDDRIAEASTRALVVQFGGAVGNLSALGDRGPAVARALGAELGLPVPTLAWHTHRDRVAEVATTLGLATGTLGKIARDLALHAQTEVAEVFEPTAPGGGGSSTLPHKRNPVRSTVVLAAAARVPGLVSTLLAGMIQEDERGVGGWHAEWEVLPELVALYAGALHRITETMGGLRVDAARMGVNLDLTRGVILSEAVRMALAAEAGRADSERLVKAACARAEAEKRHLSDVLAGDPEVARYLGGPELALLFDPRRSLGATDQLIDAVLKSHAARRHPAGREAR